MSCTRWRRKYCIAHAGGCSERVNFSLSDGVTHDVPPSPSREVGQHFPTAERQFRHQQLQLHPRGACFARCRIVHEACAGKARAGLRGTGRRTTKGRQVRCERLERPHNHQGTCCRAVSTVVRHKVPLAIPIRIFPRPAQPRSHPLLLSTLGRHLDAGGMHRLSNDVRHIGHR